MAKQEKDLQSAGAQAAEPKEEQKEEPKMVIDVPKDRVDKLIRQHVWGAMAVGLIPLPLVDFAAVTAVQLNMLRMLSKEYNIRFLKDTVKNVLSSLVGGVVPAAVSGPIAFSLVKAIPVIGLPLGVATMPIFNGASTYAVGKVFNQHFASGGTFLSFDPDKVRAFYQEMLQEGQKVATAMKSDTSTTGKP